MSLRQPPAPGVPGGSSSEFLRDPADGPSASASSAASTPLPREQRPKIPVAEVARANKDAQVKGVGLGIGSGILATLVARRSLRLGANASALSGFLTGTFVAWYGSRQFLLKSLSALERQLAGLQAGRQAPGIDPSRPHTGIGRPHLAHAGDGTGGARSAAAAAEAERLDLMAAGERRFEAGAGGQHELRDRYATTRGDH